ncbi:hypothetical protein BD414DRAFT_488390 [Trametes punicea]|nr:hypothetical protein BD414DRAFT_488390 [Trametes punicea]
MTLWCSSASVRSLLAESAIVVAVPIRMPFVQVPICAPTLDVHGSHPQGAGSPAFPHSCTV